MKTAIALVLACLAGSASAQTSCQTIGTMTICSDGRSFNQIGNNTFGSDGSSAQRIGDQTFINPAPRPMYSPPVQPYQQQIQPVRPYQCGMTPNGQYVCR